MSDIKTSVVWQPLYAIRFEEDPDVDVVTVKVQGCGHDFAISCAGYKGMMPQEFIGAMRAATAVLIRAMGGDTSIVGAEVADAAQFDTGDQRAN